MECGQSRELCTVSPRALRLQPLARDVGAAQPGGERVFELRFDAAQLEPGAREECARMAPARGTDWRQGRLICSASEFAAAAARAPDLALLHQVQRIVQARPPRPRMMGIVNVTPDSFSDGGRYLDPRAAVEHGLMLQEQGAAILDVGGESTRPKARAVSTSEELQRVLPVISELARTARVPISIDTTKAAVARAALDAGAKIVNDISAGLSDATMLPLVAERGASLVLMHMQGTPQDMQDHPTYRDVTGEVAAFLRARLARALECGIDPRCIWLDPGIGFGKSLEHNLCLIRDLSWLRSLGCELLVGPSRKSFLAAIAREHAGPQEALPGRLGGTAAAVAACVRGGASLLRVHDVEPMLAAAQVAWSIGAQDASPLGGHGAPVST